MEKRHGVELLDWSRLGAGARSRSGRLSVTRCSRTGRASACRSPWHAAAALAGWRAERATPRT